VRNRRLASVLAFLLVATAGPAQTTSAQPDCDPFQATPVVDPSIPTAEAQLGFALGAQEVTVAESDEYLLAVDAASDRVISGVAATSVGGLALRYAVVGTEARLGDLDAVKAAINTLRDPHASGASVEAALASAPLILWVAANVHGGEESGTDAALDVLYQLAARSDCVVTEILDNAVVVILPIQNPDGRELEQRRNLYGFDMNRDWFARTQPETDGKLELIREYPPMLFIDAHEFGLPNYFFPPNADPEYHEIPDRAHDWIKDLYSPAIAGEFDRQGVKYFHGAPYDFFAMIFGDTVPTAGFHAAGMTFEKEGGDPIAVRQHEQFTSIWASLFAGASSRASVLQGWRDSYVDAFWQGVNGELEANNVFERRHDLYQPVPDLTVRHYFLPPDPDRAYELQLLVRRLQRMDVEVRQLAGDLSLADFHPYGDPAGARTVPAGSYWIPLAQAQKHWIQAMLHEESWIPFDVTYDVSAWSNPLLMNLRGGWSGDDLSGVAVPFAVVPPQAEPAWPGDQGATTVGMYEIPSTRGFESTFQTKYLFEQVWGLDYEDVSVSDILAGLPGIDVLVVPDGYANYALQAFGAKGKRALRDWVNGGGRIVAWQGGAEVVARSGASTARFGGSHTNMPGTLVRVTLDDSSPLTAGVGALDWVMYLDDRVMAPGLGTSVGAFPAPGEPGFATSGLAIGVETLAGTSVLVDEAVGNGRVISFSIDPNFRAWTQGTQRLLWNAIVGPDPSGAPGLFAGSRERAAAEKAALDAAAALPDLGIAIRIRVARVDATATAKVLQRRSSEIVRIDLGAETLFLVGNRRYLGSEEHPWFALAIRELEAAGIDIRAASLP
jgi:Zinc carboxypeptidase